MFERIITYAAFVQRHYTHTKCSETIPIMEVLLVDMPLLNFLIAVKRLSVDYQIKHKTINDNIMTVLTILLKLPHKIV